MANEHNLAETEPNRLFNHVADEVAHGDHHLRVDAHLLADKALTVVARHQHHALQPAARFISSSRESERFQLSSDIGVTIPVVPIIEIPPRIPSRAL